MGPGTMNAWVDAMSVAHANATAFIILAVGAGLWDGIYMGSRSVSERCGGRVPCVGEVR